MDTGAEVSILSQRAFDMLPRKPPVITEVTMRNASENSSFQAKKVGPVDITIKDITIRTDIYVGPINDDMLLGFQLLKFLEAKLDIGEGKFTIKETTIPMEVQGERSTEEGGHEGPNKEPETRRLVLPQAIKIPAWSEVVTAIPGTQPCQSPLTTFEPGSETPVYMARTLFNSKQQPIVSVLNTSDAAVVIPAGTQIGTLNPTRAEDLELRVGEEEIDKEGQVRQVGAEKAGEQANSDREDKKEGNLHQLWSNLDPSVSKETQEGVRKLVEEYEEIFAKSKYDLGNFSAIHHSIDTGDAMPVKLGLRRTPVHYLEEERKIIEGMLGAGIIERSSSSWSAAPVLVKKKNGEIRYALDYRKVNELTKKDVFPLNNMGDCIDALEGNKYFSKLDANSAYWQVPLDADAKAKTAFRTRMGLFQFKRLPFGLCNAPATFSRVMDLILQNLQWDVVLCFLDDLCVIGKSEEEHLANLEKVFRRFKEFGLKLKPQKCELFQTEVEFLGRWISPDGTTLTDHSIKTIQEWEKPKSILQVQSILGLANYHREYIKDLAELADPLYQLVRDKHFQWGEAQQEAFDKLKSALLSPAVLAIPTKEDHFILACDASNTCIGAELLQRQGGKERVIAYGSFALEGPQLNYCTTRKELLSLLRFCHHFRHYLLGRPFTARTDHHSLLWLHRFKHPQGQLMRWLEQLAEFSMTIEHRAGKLHTNADALSRRPAPNCCLKEAISNLPCGGCDYCRRTEDWEQFRRDVDNVIPLAAEPTIRRIVKEDSIGIDIIIDMRATALETEKDDYPWEPHRIAEEQGKDPALRLLLPFLRDQVTPPKEDINLAGPEEKFYWGTRASFFLDQEVIWYDNPHGAPLLVVPNQLKNHVIFTNHDLPSAGHQSFERTRDRLKAKYFWYQLSSDTKRYVYGCKDCNRNKSATKANRHPRVIFHAGTPMEKVHLDFLGPLPRSDSGMESILVMVDQFTKWVEAVALPNQEAETMAMAAVNEFFARFGFPLQLVTDQGANFQSKLFTEICKLLQIHKLRTTAYRPSANGQVERVNRTLMSIVRNFVSPNQRDWDKYLPLITAAIRSCKHRATERTPNLMMLGRELRCPTELTFPFKLEPAMAPDNYVQKLRARLQEAHESARLVLKTQLKKEKKRYDLRQNFEKFTKGDAVYLLDKKPAKKGKTKKLQPIWTGPFVVTACPNPYTLIIKTQTKESIAISHDMAKHCHDAKLPTWITNVQESLRTGDPIKFCLCKRPQEGSMVMCESCHDWFHLGCVGLNPRSVLAVGDFLCPHCQ